MYSMSNALGAPSVRADQLVTILLSPAYRITNTSSATLCFITFDIDKLPWSSRSAREQRISSKFGAGTERPQRRLQDLLPVKYKTCICSLYEAFQGNVQEEYSRRWHRWLGTFRRVQIADADRECEREACVKIPFLYLLINQRLMRIILCFGV